MDRCRVRGFRHEWFHRGVPFQRGTNSSCGNYNGGNYTPTRQNTTVQWISSSINSTANQSRTTFRMNTSDFNIKNGTQRMIVAFGNWNDATDFPLKHAPDTRTPLIVDIFAGTMYHDTCTSTNYHVRNTVRYVRPEYYPERDHHRSCDLRANDHRAGDKRGR
jgi:hypothetical protein